MFQDNFKYNYIIFLCNTDYYKIAYSDLETIKNVSIHFGFNPRNKILAYFHRVHISPKIQHYFPIPLKSLWYSSYFVDNFIDRTKPKCFIFSADFIENEHYRSYLLYLKNKYLNSKFVCYYTDLIEPVEGLSKSKPDRFKFPFDLMISYDEGDAKRYNLKFFNTSFSDVTIPIDNALPECDVYYLGQPKTRWNRILNAYNTLISSNLKCNFYILNMPEDLRIKSSGLIYIDNPMSYEDNLRHVVKSRCLLDITQEGSVGLSLRAWECIHFGKCLLTDNYSIKKTKFYNNRYVSIINADGSIDIDFLKVYRQYDNPLKDLIRPIHFLKFIQENL